MSVFVWRKFHNRIIDKSLDMSIGVRSNGKSPGRTAALNLQGQKILFPFNIVPIIAPPDNRRPRAAVMIGDVL